MKKVILGTLGATGLAILIAEAFGLTPIRGICYYLAFFFGPTLFPCWK